MDSANADTKKCIWVKKKRRGKGSNQLYHSGKQRAFPTTHAITAKSSKDVCVHLRKAKQSQPEYTSINSAKLRLFSLNGVC